MPVLVSLFVGLLAAAVIVAAIFFKLDSGFTCWAFGTLGTLVGYWLIPRPRG